MDACPCAECAAGRHAPVPTTQRLRHAVTSSLVHERDRLVDRVAELEARVKALVDKQTYFVEFTCDACEAALSLTSTYPLNDGAEIALIAVAIGGGWTFGTGPSSGHRCPRCPA
jgi:hypothetical protein